MSHLILIELFLVVSIGWSTVSAQNFTFNQTATGPSVTCRGGVATFTCRIFNDGGFLQSNQWLFSNGTIIRSDTPNHMLSTNAMGLVTDLVVSNVDANTSYNCTTSAAPPEFTSTASLTVAGPPSTVTMLNHTVVVCTTNVSWSPSISNQVCGPVSYNVVISPSDGVMMMRITNTSYNFAGLTPDTNYTVSVAGMNMAGVGQSGMIMLRVPTMPEALPSAVTNLMTKAVRSNMIRVTWNAASSPNCGDVLYYDVVISSDEDSNIIPNNITNITMLTATFSNLRSNTSYTISVVAVNRAGAGMARSSTITTLDLASGGNGGGGLSGGAKAGIAIGCVLVFAIIVFIVVILAIFCYKEKCKVSEGSDTTIKRKLQENQPLDAYATVDVASKVEEKSREEQLMKKKTKGSSPPAKGQLNYIDPTQLEIEKGPGADRFGGDHKVSYGQVTES